MQFQGGNKVVGELEHYHRMEDAVMKFMTVRVPQDHPKSTGEAQPELQDGGVQ